MDSAINRLNAISKDLDAARDQVAADLVQHRHDTERLQKKIRTLENQRREDQKRIEKLQSEVYDLRQYKKATTPGTQDEELEEDKDAGMMDFIIKGKLEKLKETYDPEKVTSLSWPVDGVPARFASGVHHLRKCYRDIYQETVSLVRIAGSLRDQVKHQRKRAEQWQRWCAGLSTRNKAPNSTNPNTIASTTEQPVGQQNDTLSTPISTGAQDGGQDVPSSSAVASTASNSSPIPPALSKRASGPRAENDGRDQSRTLRVKDEPLSPGLLDGPPLGQERFPAASEDLDEVGDAVTTPRSRRFAVFEDRSNRIQHEGSNTTPNFQGDHRRAFQPKDINQLRTPRESAFKRRKTCDSGASAISTVAEDGEDQNDFPSAIKIFTTIENDTPTKIPARNTDAHRRLDDLLAARPQRQSPALDRPRVRNPVQSTALVSTQANQTSRPMTARESIAYYRKLESKRAATKRKFQQEADPNNEEDWEAVMKSRPFRELPVDCLNLGHFKLNPARNQGLDYAFKEVVRGEQRKCLPGCMRADCCGEKFRAMVRATGIEYDAERHRSLLEEHLGDQKNALQQMSEPALNGLLIEAKARQLANQFGKHRQAYERARSPPGFWRTDMPSTQELAKDRIEADRMERERIVERLSEAMRPDGLWKFADEI